MCQGEKVRAEYGLDAYSEKLRWNEGKKCGLHGLHTGCAKHRSLLHLTPPQTHPFASSTGSARTGFSVGPTTRDPLLAEPGPKEARIRWWCVRVRVSLLPHAAADTSFDEPDEEPAAKERKMRSTDTALPVLCLGERTTLQLAICGTYCKTRQDSTTSDALNLTITCRPAVQNFCWNCSLCWAEEEIAHRDMFPRCGIPRPQKQRSQFAERTNGHSTSFAAKSFIPSCCYSPLCLGLHFTAVTFSPRHNP